MNISYVLSLKTLLPVSFLIHFLEVTLYQYFVKDAFKFYSVEICSRTFLSFNFNNNNQQTFKHFSFYFILVFILPFVGFIYYGMKVFKAVNLWTY